MFAVLTITSDDGLLFKLPFGIFCATFFSLMVSSIKVFIGNNSAAMVSIFARKRSFTHCCTNLLGASMRKALSPSVVLISSACRGLIQVLNCCADSSCSKRLRQVGQKFSIRYLKSMVYIVKLLIILYLIACYVRSNLV